MLQPTTISNGKKNHKKKYSKRATGLLLLFNFANKENWKQEEEEEKEKKWKYRNLVGWKKIRWVQGFGI